MKKRSAQCLTFRPCIYTSAQTAASGWTLRESEGVFNGRPRATGKGHDTRPRKYSVSSFIYCRSCISDQ